MGPKVCKVRFMTDPPFYLENLLSRNDSCNIIFCSQSTTIYYDHLSGKTLPHKTHTYWYCPVTIVVQVSMYKFKNSEIQRMKTYLIEAFMCHTHNAAWHTLHNIICGSATKMERYLDIVRDKLSCTVNVFHGEHDELVPVECSHAVGLKIPRARVKVYEKKDHITVIVGQERLFARELEEIWKSASSK